MSVVTRICEITIAFEALWAAPAVEVVVATTLTCAAIDMNKKVAARRAGSVSTVDAARPADGKQD